MQGLFIFCVTIFILLDFCENFKYNIFVAATEKKQFSPVFVMIAKSKWIGQDDGKGCGWLLAA